MLAACSSSPPRNLLFSNHRSWRRSTSIVFLEYEKKSAKMSQIQALPAMGTEERIRESLIKVDYPRSSYDTAWVAMVPSPGDHQIPCFPHCLDWILENQNVDGSWGISHSHPSMIKDGLSSTLACVLALKRWNVGKTHIKKGLDFIESYFSSSLNAQLHSPIGFGIIFPGLVEYALDMGFVFPDNKNDINALFLMRKSEVERLSAFDSEEGKSFLAYVAEGMGRSQNWLDVMRYQRKNGSLFDSPSTTAAALLNLRDDKALEYLQTLLQKFENSVPAAFPFDMQFLLPLVDKIESLGISRHFPFQIRSILDQAYRCWMLNEEDIKSNVTTYAMAFRLLRVNGYVVSSDSLSQVDEENKFYNFIEGQGKDASAVLELYKASQIKILPDEPVLDKIYSWTRYFLQQKMSSKGINGLSSISNEVEYALKFPLHANLDRLEHKRSIQCCSIESLHKLKSTIIFDNKDVLELARGDFNLCQSIYNEELKCLDRWVKENKLDQLKFARQKQMYCYFSAAATLFYPELSDARMSWAQNGVLTTVVDDFFDVGASSEEMESLIAVFEKWDDVHEDECCSKQVEIVFSALRRNIMELSTKAFKFQERNITHHLVEIWLSLLKSMRKEAEWSETKSVPTAVEYLTAGLPSFALGPIVLPALYFVGPKLSVEVIQHPEYANLFRLLSTCGRLLNDIQTFERESKAGKPNMLSLLIHHRGGSFSEEEAKRELMQTVETNRREFLRLVLQDEGSVVPRACKDLFWKMCRVLHVFYERTDGFSSPKEMLSAVNAVLNEPLDVDKLKQASAV